jgi:hypothetical protein
MKALIGWHDVTRDFGQVRPDRDTGSISAIAAGITHPGTIGPLQVATSVVIIVSAGTRLPLGGNRGPGSCPDDCTNRSSSATADRTTDDGTGRSAHDRAAQWVLRCGMFKGCTDCERKQASEREFRHHVSFSPSLINQYRGRH